MKKEYSLTNKIYFNKVINSDKKIRSNYLYISYINSNDLKIGISVPKKLGNAVFRNKNKRIIKSILADLIKSDSVTKAHIVIIVKEPFTKKTYIEKTNIISEQLKKIKHV